MTYILFLDDKREPFQKLMDDPREVVVCRNMYQVGRTWDERGLPSHMAFDWYLGPNQALTGEDAARILIQMAKTDKKDNPENTSFIDEFTFSIHTNSEEAAEKIRKLLVEGLKGLGVTDDREIVVQSSSELYD